MVSVRPRSDCPPGRGFFFSLVWLILSHMDTIDTKLNALAESLARIEAKLDELLLSLDEEEDQIFDDGPFGRDRARGELL